MVRESRLKKAGMFALGPLAFAGFIALAFVLFLGMIWASAKALPYLITASEIAIVVCVFVFLPLCILRKTRPWAGVAFFYASYVFGTMLFAYSCLFVVDAWGVGGLFIGLAFAGVGVVPVALLAALLHANWLVLAELVIDILLTFGTRGLGIYLSSKTPEPEPVWEDEAA
jgi:hypothetical protein